MKIFTQSTCAWTGAITFSTFFCVFSTTAVCIDPRVDSATNLFQRSDLRKELKRSAVDSIPSLYKGEEADVGPQYIVKQQAQKKWFEALIDYQFLSTSNVYLAENNPQQSTLMVTTAQFSIAPEPWETEIGKFSIKSGYRHQRFNYGKFNGDQRNLNNNDFDASTVFTAGRLAFSENHAAWAGIDYTRLLNASNGSYDEFYAEAVPSVGVDGQYRLNEKTAFVASLSGALHLTRVKPPNRSNLNDRTDQVLTVSFVREITPRINFQPFYRALLTEYLHNGGRKDFIQSLGASLNYTFNQWASLRLFASVESRESTDNTVSSYRKFDGGIGAGFFARF